MRFGQCSNYVLNTRIILYPELLQCSVSHHFLSLVLVSFSFFSNSYYRGVRGTQWPHVLLLCVLSSLVNNAQETLGLPVKSLSAANHHGISAVTSSGTSRSVWLHHTTSLLLRTYRTLITGNQKIIYLWVTSLLQIVKRVYNLIIISC